MIPKCTGSTPTPTAKEVQTEAEALYLEGDVDGALAKYAEAAALDPEDPEIKLSANLRMDLIVGDKYVKLNATYVTLGCTNHCKFC